MKIKTDKSVVYYYPGDLERARHMCGAWTKANPKTIFVECPALKYPTRVLVKRSPGSYDTDYIPHTPQEMIIMNGPDPYKAWEDGSYLDSFVKFHTKEESDFLGGVGH